MNVLLLRVYSDVFKNTKHPIHIYPPLLLKYMQSLIVSEEIADVTLIDCWVDRMTKEEILEIIKKKSICVVVTLVDTFTLYQSNEYMQFCKKHVSLLTVGVGPGISLLQENLSQIENNFDVVLSGESEYEVISLLKESKAQTSSFEQIREKYSFCSGQKEPILIDFLDSLPFLIWDKDELKRYSFLYPLRVKKKIICGYITTTRGCPHNCIFCSSIVRKSYGKKVRYMSVKRVVDEIEYLMSLGVNTICFEDENIVVSKEHIVSICEEIKERKLKIHWIAHARVEDVDPTILALMKEAGCELLLFGVESGADRVISVIKKSTCTKEWSAMVIKKFAQVKQAAIASCALFIHGSPKETEQEVDLSISLVKNIQPDMIKVHFFTPYPGSKIYEECKDTLSENIKLSMHHYCDPLVNLSNMTDKVLKSKHKEFYKKFLLQPEFIYAHLKKYLFFYLYNWKAGVYLIWHACAFIFQKSNKRA